MGTNYYHRTNICDCCDRYDQRHIGKSSMGWQFCFQAYVREPWDDAPIDEIRSWTDWQRELDKGGAVADEYGQVVPLDEFKSLVAFKFTDPRNQNHVTYLHANVDRYGKVDPTSDWLDPDGHAFSVSEFS